MLYIILNFKNVIFFIVIFVYKLIYIALDLSLYFSFHRNQAKCSQNSKLQILISKFVRILQTQNAARP
jgi:hypothetical protein